MDGPWMDLSSMESAALPVRKGDLETIDRLCSHYANGPGGTFRKLLPAKRAQLASIDLLAASEALEARGSYRAALVPLEQLIMMTEPDGPVGTYAAARFGLLSIFHSLPADIRPITSMLRIDGRPIRSRVSWPRKGSIEEVLPELERFLMGALLLHHRAMNISSRPEKEPYLQAARSWSDNALAGARALEGGPRAYHEARALYHYGSMSLLSSDLKGGVDQLNECLEMAKGEGFTGLVALCSLELGPLSAEATVREGLLLSAGSELERLGNRPLALEVKYVRGLTNCSESATTEGMIEAIELMTSAADGLEKVGLKSEGAIKRAEASLWLTRAGRPEEALAQVKDAVAVLRKAEDPEGISLAMASGFLALIKLEERKRAKRTLLDLVLRYPVKQYNEAFEVLKEAISGQTWLREDPDTSEMFKDVPVRTIDRQAVKDIIARAKEAYPNEFGAMLRGVDRITHIEPLMDTASGRSTVMFSLFDRLSQRSVQGEGVVHSHPSGSNRPSNADLYMFSRFPGINIIIGFPFTEATMAAYDRLGNGVELKVI